MSQPCSPASRLLRALVALVSAAAAAGCDEEKASDFRSDLGAVEASAQRPGDPDAGYRALLNEPYVSCGMPYQAYRRVAPDPSPVDIPAGRFGRNAELPYSLTASVNDEGVEIVANNCLTCHAARIGDELIIGLGDEFGDFTRDPRRFALRVGGYVRGEAETRAWRFWADRLEGVAPYIRTRTVGPNPATNLTWALMAHLDPETLAWSDAPLIEPPQADPLPISVPPWWGMRRKTAMFYTTIGRGDHARFMLLASMLCVKDAGEPAAIDAYAPDIRAYIASLEPPAYPYPIDRAAAATGEEIYRRTCERCHGGPEGQGAYPNRVYGLDEVGTDPAYATAATDGSRDRFYDWLVRSPYGDGGGPAPAPGYIAPPLDGVWATAPYLHNGSVPNMDALLQSGLRPAYWRHVVAPRAYDPVALGWRHEALEADHADATAPELRRLTYDTTRHGYGNAGHAYGDHLDAAERAALIEHLKTF